jgi:hypothetical protein
MKKIIFIGICALMCSCSSIREANQSPKPRYYQEYIKGELTYSEYDFLCKGYNEMPHLK